MYRERDDAVKTLHVIPYSLSEKCNSSGIYINSLIMVAILPSLLAAGAASWSSVSQEVGLTLIKCARASNDYNIIILNYP